METPTRKTFQCQAGNPKKAREVNGSKPCPHVIVCADCYRCTVCGED